MKEKKYITGSKIVSLHGRRSMYDNDCLEAQLDNGTVVLIHANELIKIVNDFNWEVQKKKKWDYLVNPQYWFLIKEEK